MVCFSTLALQVSGPTTRKKNREVPVFLDTQIFYKKGKVWFGSPDVWSGILFLFIFEIRQENEKKKREKKNPFTLSLKDD